MQSETGFPSSHQLKSYVAFKSRLKLAARAVLSADAGLLVIYSKHFLRRISTDIVETFRHMMCCYSHNRKVAMWIPSECKLDSTLSSPMSLLCCRARNTQQLKKASQPASLWPPYIYIFILFLMVALCNRADHNIFMLFLSSSSSFFSSPNLSGRRLDVYHMVWP